LQLSDQLCVKLRWHQRASTDGWARLEGRATNLETGGKLRVREAEREARQSRRSSWLGETNSRGTAVVHVEVFSGKPGRLVEMSYYNCVAVERSHLQSADSRQVSAQSVEWCRDDDQYPKRHGWQCWQSATAGRSFKSRMSRSEIAGRQELKAGLARSDCQEPTAGLSTTSSLLPYGDADFSSQSQTMRASIKQRLATSKVDYSIDEFSQMDGMGCHAS
ncbi:hypothetical protein THAOC_22464, partial [Thalassiosira oceanica]